VGLMRGSVYSQKFRRRLDVVIHIDQDRRAGPPRPMIARDRWPLIGLLDEVKAVGRLQGADRLRRPIGRAVRDDKDLEGVGRKRLPGQGAERAQQALLAVIGRY